MQPIADRYSAWQTTAQNAAWRARALEKPHAASDLRGEGQSEAHPEPQQRRKAFAHPSPHYGTQADVPFRHAPSPRLTAAFTAQLLGQILPDPERKASAAAAYGEQAVRARLGLDKRL